MRCPSEKSIAKPPLPLSKPQPRTLFCALLLDSFSSSSRHGKAANRSTRSPPATAAVASKQPLRPPQSLRLQSLPLSLPPLCRHLLTVSRGHLSFCSRYNKAIRAHSCRFTSVPLDRPDTRLSSGRHLSPFWYDKSTTGTTLTTLTGHRLHRSRFLLTRRSVIPEESVISR